MPSDVILSLVQALRDASRLHEPAGDRSVGKSSSPSLTAVSSRDSGDARSNASSRMASDHYMQASADTTLDGTTMDDEELPRERFAYWCLDLLFLMCNRASEGENDEADASNSVVDRLTFALYDRERSEEKKDCCSVLPSTFRPLSFRPSSLRCRCVRARQGAIHQVSLQLHTSAVAVLTVLTLIEYGKRSLSMYSHT